MSPDDKSAELARLGIRNAPSPQEIAVARAKRAAIGERRKAERDRKRDQRRKARR